MQKIRFFFGLAALSLCCGSAWAQTTLTRDQALKLLSRPGRWIDTGGAPQDDGTYLASQIQIVAAADEAQMIDPAITGIVENLDPAKGTLTVLGYKITFDSNKTVFKDAKKKPI